MVALTHQQAHDKMALSAERYAQADRSDPFTLSRTLCHIRQGIASLYNARGEKCFYNAEPFVEMRPSPSGDETTYPVTVWRNVVRP